MSDKPMKVIGILVNDQNGLARGSCLRNGDVLFMIDQPEAHNTEIISRSDDAHK